jgi:hypothetical protein
VEHSFARETSLQVAYVGNRAIHQLTTSDINEVPPYYWNQCAFMSNCNSLRPYSNDGFLTWWAHYGDAHYHALQTLFRARVNRMLFNITYTYSHSIGNVPLDESNGTANYQTLTWAGNPSLDKGNTQINRPHMLVANVVVPLPELKGQNALVQGTLGGWQVGTILTAESGPSTTVFASGLSENVGLLQGCRISTDDPACKPSGLNSLYGTGNAGPPWAPGSNRRTFITGTSCTAGRHADQIYNPDAFSVVGHTIGSMPNEPSGYCAGPRFVNDDISVQKTWKIRERLSLQFRLDAFNFFNHPNFSPNNPGNPIGQVNCGNPDAQGSYQPCSPINNLITTQLPGNNMKATAIINNNDREFQYGLRFIF